MDLCEFLMHPKLQLPSTRDSDTDFEEYIHEQHAIFLSLIGTLDSGSVADRLRARRAALESYSEQLRLALRCSFEGQVRKAYVHLESAMQVILPDINTLAFKVNGPAGLGTLYRVQRNPAPELKAVDLFHIPFELRHRVATQRYSIPGLPCLYLAGSLYACWEEMGRPPFHELHCAALWVKDGKEMRLLNLSNRPGRLAVYACPPGSEPPEPDRLAAQIMLWPLVFLCSIKTKHPNAPFKPEYVVPQMVLQWVTQDHGFDGVVYFSTHVKYLSLKNPMFASNVVIPVKTIAPTGRCASLCDTFKITDPMGWQLLSSINVGATVPSAALAKGEVEFIEGDPEPYSHSEFGSVERKLNTLVLKKRRSPDPQAGDISPT
jgi:hypothetical protein